MKPLGFLLLALVAASACGTDGYTPACPELEPYDIRKTSERTKPDVLAARNAAIEAGCVTAPAPAGSGGAGASDAGASATAGAAPEAEATGGDGGADPAPAP